MQQKHIKGCRALLAAASGVTIKDIIKLKNTYKHFIISTISFIWAAAWIPAVCCRGWRAASWLVFSYNPEVWDNPGPPGPRGGGRDPDYSVVTKLHRSQETFGSFECLWHYDEENHRRDWNRPLNICSSVLMSFLIFHHVLQHLFLCLTAVCVTFTLTLRWRVTWAYYLAQAEQSVVEPAAFWLVDELAHHTPGRLFRSRSAHIRTELPEAHWRKTLKCTWPGIEGPCSSSV